MAQETFNLSELTDEARDNIQQKYIAAKLVLSKPVQDWIEGPKAEGFVDACNLLIGEEAMMENNPYTYLLS